MNSMKRRNFFKILAGSVGAAIVVPEVLRKNNPAPKESLFLKLDDTPKSAIPDDKYIPIHPVFKILQTGEWKHHELIYVYLEDGEIINYGHYFHCNDSILAGLDRNESSMYLVTGKWMVNGIDCLCLETLSYTEPGTYRKAQAGDNLVLAYNSFAEDRLTGKII